MTLLERLVVGAGQEKVAIDTPQAVTVVGQQDIDREQATLIGDVLKRIPGVNTSGSDRAFGQTFNIRGIGAPENAGEEGRIIVNVDGVNKFYEQYRMGGFFSDPELYKKVEVLRGPASSTLYGSGALGGVINFTTKDASDFIDPGKNGALRLKGSYSSNEQGWLSSFVLAQRLSSDAEVLLTGNYRTADNYTAGDGTEIRSTFFDTWSGLAKVTANVGDEGRARLSYQRWDSDADGQDYAQSGSDAVVMGTPTFGYVDRHVVDDTIVASYENPFSGNDWLDLKLSASYSNTTTEQRNATGNPMFGLTCASSALFCDTDYGYLTAQFNIENTSEFHGDNWDSYLTYGWQFAHQERSADVLTESASSIEFHPGGSDLRNGLFVQNEFLLGESFTLVTGVRFDTRRLSPDASTGVSGEFTDTAVSPKVAAHYRFNDTVAVFGSFAHTERFPTIDEVFSTTSSRSAFLPSFGLEKEKSDNWEGGIALSGYDVFRPGDSVQMKATYFNNTIQDLIALNPALVPGFNNTQGYVNIDRARIHGVEIELAYDSEYVFGSVGYSHVIGRNTTNDQYLTTIAPDELSFTIGGRLPDRGIEFGLKSRLVADPQDSCRQSTVSVTCPGASASRFSQSFNVHDVYLTWAPKDGQFAGWETQFGIDNIFDRNHKEFLNNDYAKGRTFKISLAKKFGW
ncbi:TonB-dependent hemoglobin/transferrin/lactoferrin family receptor [Pseudohoeflea coraliihabitans]|uniref:TonB-dependent hemoglobin/transferrin/lactoferrin family receptor n=1 Tax=Pseudohoeflea coraliihabitans TaxID=2860393 RepID=A0ABS6WP19_9HYPH|nr:TonB-dependent hemoglobin/transferrin/lactoferrin family receptor [Pseudohoeflea sp. DP4N28-3]MBW3097711.1 TonB-dependent hemoglobin/transferrin/lactoferrin family receptor [Pseudohoeflea sp. DP4N28-3]